MAEKKDNSKGKKEGKLSALATRVLLKPRITEKAYAVNALNQYVFQVTDTATKTQVRQAIEDIYGVSVIAVNMIKLHSKKRVFGKSVGKKSPIKKAVVRLKTGDTIELFKAGI